MHAYLRQHPDIYMPAEKEQNHFATDLLPTEYPYRDPYIDRENYMSLFAGARDEKRVGETSVFHLYSKAAAENIFAFNASSRIIIMLRDPVSWMASYHSQMVYNGDEVIADLQGALDAEERRRRGKDIPENLRFMQRLLYRDVVRFSGQVARYLDRFGRDAVHIILQDDFARNARAVFREALDFLDVDPEFQPEFITENTNKTIRSMWLSNFLVRPPAWVAAPVMALLPRTRRRNLRERIKTANAVTREREPLDPALRNRLAAELRPDVDRLAELIGRDLSHWCAAS